MSRQFDFVTCLMLLKMIAVGKNDHPLKWDIY